MDLEYKESKQKIAITSSETQTKTLKQALLTFQTLKFAFIKKSICYN
jgi:hypothetical protein